VNIYKTSFYFASGLAILLLNKIRYAARGYRDARPFSPAEVKKSVEYDRGVVDIFEEFLSDYCKSKHPFSDKTVLELGPGPDIGVGALLLDKGARKYTAFDVNPLMDSTPTEFYLELAKDLELDETKRQLALFEKRKSDRLVYVADPAFNIRKVGEKSVDLVVSMAAFEHFVDPLEALRQLTTVVRDGAVLCAEIDLMTHSRWIREADPNNIYRFPRPLYRLLNYSGIPNRVRPETWERLMAELGWQDIRIIPRLRLDSTKLSHSLRGLSRSVGDSDMSVLTCILLARKLH